MCCVDVLTAATSGTRRDLLVACRRRLAEAADRVDVGYGARVWLALTKEITRISRELAEIDAQATARRHLRAVPDESWDEGAI